MNAAWHRRRAKREIRQGGPIRLMPHALQLSFVVTVDVACAQGAELRIVSKAAA